MNLNLSNFVAKICLVFLFSNFYTTVRKIFDQLFVDISVGTLQVLLDKPN